MHVAQKKEGKKRKERIHDVDEGGGGPWLFSEIPGKGKGRVAAC